MTDTNFISNLDATLSMSKEELHRKLEQEGFLINEQLDPFSINLLTGLIVEPMCDKAKDLLTLCDLHAYLSQLYDTNQFKAFYFLILTLYQGLDIILPSSIFLLPGHDQALELFCKEFLLDLQDYLDVDE
jgi:hypothetical protein